MSLFFFFYKTKYEDVLSKVTLLNVHAKRSAKPKTVYVQLKMSRVIFVVH